VICKILVQMLQYFFSSFATETAKWQDVTLLFFGSCLYLHVLGLDLLDSLVSVLQCHCLTKGARRRGKHNFNICQQWRVSKMLENDKKRC